jgi:type I restriction enzyme S subunit
MEVKPGYKQTEVGIIPDDWAISCVGDSFDVCNELRFPISQSERERMVGPYPYYGPTSVQGWINEYRVEGEYALIGEDGDHFLKWRSQPMTLLVRGKFNVNNHAHLVRGTKNITAWFYWFFSNRNLTPYLTRQGAGRYKLTKAALLNIPCALPPKIEEQRAITGALSDVDALISGLDQLIAKRRDLKQATMQQLLAGKKRLPGFNGVWELKQLRDIAHINMGQSPDSRNYNQSGIGIPLIQGNADIENRKSIRRVWTTQITKTCDEGDLILTVRAPVGSIGVASEHSCLGRGVCSLKPINAHAPFLFHAMVFAESHWKILEQGSTFTAANSAQIAEFPLMITGTHEEQTAIATVLSDMDSELVALQQRRDKTCALKQGMMQELLTGRIRLV